VFFILHFAFFALHYLFASQTAHIGALYAAFLAMMLASGAVPWCFASLNLLRSVATWVHCAHLEHIITALDNA
jgi:DASS family divalent anion:Na+ symporter